MLALAHFFVRDNLPFWLQPAGQKCLKEVFRKLAGLPGLESLHLLTDAADVFSFLDDKKLVLSECSPPPPEAEHGYAFLAWLLERLRPELGPNDSPLAIVNPRNLHLDAQTLSQALLRLDKTSKPGLLGCVKPEDHPCQYVSPVRIHDIGHLNLFEIPEDLEADLAGFSDQDHLITREFFYSWDALTPRGQGPWLRRIEPGGYGPLGAWLDPTCRKLYENEQLLLSEGWDRARFCWPRAMVLQRYAGLMRPGESLIGANLTARYGEPLLAALRGPEGCVLRLEASALPLHELSLSGVFTDREGYAYGQALRHSFEDESPSLKIPDPGKAVQGLAYSLLAHAQNGISDYLKPFAPEPELWRHDPYANCSVNVQTGEFIVGRQFFPELYELDDSLLLLRASKLSEVLQELAGPGGFELFELAGQAYRDDKMTLAACLCREA